VEERLPYSAQAYEVLVGPDELHAQERESKRPGADTQGQHSTAVLEHWEAVEVGKPWIELVAEDISELEEEDKPAAADLVVVDRLALQVVHTQGREQDTD
jgi:hypothetical protein